MPAVPLPDDFGAMLDDLRRRLIALERSPQGGNTAITVTASPAATTGGKGTRILDASLAERVRLGVTDSDASPAAAQGLYGISAKDGSGKVRALFGQIPSGYGFALFDAFGNAILDSTGLQQVASGPNGVATTGGGGGLTLAGPQTKTVILGGSATIQSARNSFIQFLLMTAIAVKITAGAGTANLYVTTVDGNGVTQHGSGLAVGPTMTAWTYVPNVDMRSLTGASNSSVAITVDVPAGTTIAYDGGYAYAFRFGA